MFFLKVVLLVAWMLEPNKTSCNPCESDPLWLPGDTCLVTLLCILSITDEQIAPLKEYK